MHLTATRSKGDTWECVGSDQKLKAVETYTGFTEGKMMAIDFNTVNQTQSLLEQGKCILTDINGLFQDIKRICVKRDKIIENNTKRKFAMFRALNRPIPKVRLKDV